MPPLRGLGKLGPATSAGRGRLQMGTEIIASLTHFIEAPMHGATS
jgi:hypothetical protein